MTGRCCALGWKQTCCAALCCADLQDMEQEERREVLRVGGLDAAQVEEVETMLSAMPTLWATAQCVVEKSEVGPQERPQGRIARAGCRWAGLACGCQGVAACASWRQGHLVCNARGVFITKQ